MAIKQKTVKAKISKAELKKYQKALEEVRERLFGDLEHLKEDHLKKNHKEMSGELSGYSIHLADMSSDDYDQGIGLGLVTQEQEILYLVEKAIEKIKDGSYGICEITGKPISKKRLDAVPYATLCLDAQRELEKKKKV